jgi:glycosyltransferase involved in cell wall biosynthesis
VTLVSVIIPSYNRAQKASRAVSSVLDQSFKDLEIIVIDDGSTDDTIDMLEQFRDRITLIKHPENRGVSAARNSGINASRSPLIAFLDSDDYWMPEKLETQVRYLRENTDAVICQTEEIWIRNGVRVNPWKKHIKPSGDIFEQSLKLCLVSPSAVMIRRSLLDEVGLFDEAFPVCEDYDLWLRISWKYPVHLINQFMLVKEGGHADQLSASIRGMDRFRIKAMVKLFEKGCLSSRQAEALTLELASKCTIYGNGCLNGAKQRKGVFSFNCRRWLKGIS